MDNYTGKPYHTVLARIDHWDGADLARLTHNLVALAPLSVAIVFARTRDDTVCITCGISDGLAEVVHAGSILRAISDQYGGSGGGTKAYAQIGGCPLDNLHRAMGYAYSLLDDLRNSAI